MPAGEAGAGPQRRTQAREGSPLAYFRGRFGRFEMAQDNAAYDRLRRLVLSREAGPGDRLDVQGCPSGALTAGLPVSPHLADDHVALVDAYEHGDLAAVKQIVVSHNERAKATQRAGIERAGGRF